MLSPLDETDTERTCGLLQTVGAFCVFCAPGLARAVGQGSASGDGFNFRSPGSPDGEKLQSSLVLPDKLPLR